MGPAEQDTGAEAATAALGEEMLTHWVIQMKAAGSESATCHSCHNSGPLEPLPLGVAKARKRAGTQGAVEAEGIVKEVRCSKAARTLSKDFSKSAMDDIGRSLQAFTLSGPELNEMSKDHCCTEDEALHVLVESIRSRSRPCISGFRVGAAARGSDGRVFLGVNLEFQGLPTFSCVHAEQFAVINAICHNAKELEAIAVSAPPCGHCRQFLAELASTKMDVSVSGENDSLNLPTLLPYSFDGSAIGEENAKENSTNAERKTRRIAALTLLTDQHNDLELVQDGAVRSPLVAELVDLALLEANRSHAPYSKSPAGVALVTSTGLKCHGPYIENAAFNPAVSALQSSLVHFVVKGGGDWGDITHVVLVQIEGCSIGHEWSTQMLMQKIAKKAEFHTVKCKRTSH